MTRCTWPGTDPLYVAYHDEEWGVPVHDDRLLFEFLILEGAQAGLSWITILRKREAYRDAYAGFDAEKVARFGDDDAARLLANPGIVRNRAKVAASIKNAQAFLRVQAEFGSFARYFWDFSEGQPLTNHWEVTGQVPAVTPLAEKISKDLKKRGFGFVGPTIIYAHMQATGMVNDHLVSCFRHSQIARSQS